MRGGRLRHRESRERSSAAGVMGEGVGAGPAGLFSFFFFLSFDGDDGAAPAALLVSSTPVVLQLHGATRREEVEVGVGPGRGALSCRPRRGPAAHQ